MKKLICILVTVSVKINRIIFHTVYWFYHSRPITINYVNIFFTSLKIFYNSDSLLQIKHTICENQLVKRCWPYSKLNVSSSVSMYCIAGGTANEQFSSLSNFLLYTVRVYVCTVYQSRAQMGYFNYFSG